MASMDPPSYSEADSEPSNHHGRRLSVFDRDTGTLAYSQDGLSTETKVTGLSSP